MRWSLKIAQVAGIGIYVHWTFLLLLAWIVLVHYREGDDAVAAVRGVGLVVAVFGCIVLHELGHALTAKWYGINTRDITLLPIGGVARLEGMPEEPWQEFWVAVAGPAVNVVIAAILFVPCLLLGQLDDLLQAGDVPHVPFLVSLMAINLWLVLFNLLPAFPMDGGRVLRALLATQMPRVRATHIAAAIGQGMAIMFGLAGLLIPGAWMLLFIALFVYLGAQGEAQAVEMRSIFQGAAVREAMTTRFQTLSPSDSIQRAANELLAGHQQDFPVLNDGQMVGMLLRGLLIEAISSGREGLRVADAMSAVCPAVEENQRLDQAVQLMQSQRCSTLPVTRNGALVGLLTAENVGEWTMIQAALRDREGK
jgi:Zn-dependent protease/predicted transcriptional regulator